MEHVTSFLKSINNLVNGEALEIVDPEAEAERYPLSSSVEGDDGF